MKELVIMSKKELHRLEVIQKLAEKRLSQEQAGNQLQLSTRQIRRLLRSYEANGPEGLTTKLRKRTGNRSLPGKYVKQIIDLISNKYHDFGPTLAQEKLSELHNINLSIETVRKIMVEAGLWITRANKKKRAYQPRYRRDCFGELIQIDGSDHPWFEDRGPKCTLLVYIDDATSQLMELRFVPSESTFTYFEATKAYLKRHGKPVAFYSDKYSVFRINSKDPKGGDQITQFGRALNELNIDIICANTCQAKGRVERANKTLQDRLVKEMRLRGISTIEAGNKFLSEFMKSHNIKFGKPALNSRNAHRPLLSHEDLDEVFCWKEDRTVSLNLTIQYNKVLYILEDTVENRKLVRKRVTVYDYYDGSIKIRYGDRDISFVIHYDRLQQIDQGAIVENKRLGKVLEFIQTKQSAFNRNRSKSVPRRAI